MGYRDFFESVFIALFLAIFIRTFFITAYKIPTTSMAPTLLPGDFVFSNKIPFGLKIPFTDIKWGGRLPVRGELVIFKYPNNPKVTYVKRVIGLPGDRIEMRDKIVLVNEVPQALSKSQDLDLSQMPGSDYLELYQEKLVEDSHYLLYSKPSASDVQSISNLAHTMSAFVVPQNEVFLLGDNRDSSDDSRYWGSVPREQIEGKIFIVWLSLDWNDATGNRQMPRIRFDRVFKTLK
jgi:signal peptidase I